MRERHRDEDDGEEGKRRDKKYCYGWERMKRKEDRRQRGRKRDRGRGKQTRTILTVWLGSWDRRRLAGLDVWSGCPSSLCVRYITTNLWRYYNKTCNIRVYTIRVYIHYGLPKIISNTVPKYMYRTSDCNKAIKKKWLGCREHPNWAHLTALHECFREA